MIIRVYFRTEFIPYREENKYICHSMDEVNQLLDNIRGFTEYLLIGQTKDGDVIYDRGKLEPPITKRLKH